MLYSDKNVPEVSIPHLIIVEQRHQASLYMVLYWYCDVFWGKVPTQVLPNQKLGDVHEIPLVEGGKPIRKSMNRYKS